VIEVIRDNPKFYVLFVLSKQRVFGPLLSAEYTDWCVGRHFNFIRGGTWRHALPARQITFAFLHCSCIGSFHGNGLAEVAVSLALLIPSPTHHWISPSEGRCCLHLTIVRLSTRTWWANAVCCQYVTLGLNWNTHRIILRLLVVHWVNVFFYDMVYLLAVIGLSSDGSTHLHTNNT